MNKVWTEYRLKTLILAFCITAAWDVILRNMAEGNIYFFGVEKMKWVTVLREYFKKHTVLSAALVAGFVGAIAYAIIQYINVYYNLKPNMSKDFILLFLVSGIVGFPMRYSGLFPVLDVHYYKPLGVPYSFMTDAMSGIVVGATLLVIWNIPHINNVIYN